MEIESMSNDAVLAELKAKGLPTFGTGQERRDRLKKNHGMFIILFIWINLLGITPSAPV